MYGASPLERYRSQRVKLIMRSTESAYQRQGGQDGPGQDSGPSTALLGTSTGVEVDHETVIV
jgi:hypothetical protein